METASLVVSGSRFRHHQFGQEVTDRCHHPVEGDAGELDGGVFLHDEGGVFAVSEKLHELLGIKEMLFEPGSRLHFRWSSTWTTKQL
uniref:Uncharacterized protein n=1 Tax=Hyaloperonospora arabidopsidis (strain Emoy2) TaxID=559515 RepID=M4BWR4_HYAAE